jgi:osmoprotectant transport system substrate-binding protein
MPVLARPRVFATALIATVVIVAACSDGEEPRPTIRAAGFNFSESHVLAWIFAAAFEDAGFELDTSRIQPGSTREILKPALEEDEIDYLPEYIGTLLSFLGGEPTGNSQTNYEAARDRYAETGVALLDFAPAQDQNAFVVTRAFAEERGIQSLSDLASIADDLTFGATPECPDRPFCAIGLRDVYGIEFDEFIPLDGRSRVSALQQGTIDVALAFTTDASLAVNDWLVLEDDRGMVPAENVALAIRMNIVEAYGDELTDIVAAISAELTTETLSELNRQVQVDGEDSEAVARAWLASIGVLGG